MNNSLSQWLCAALLLCSTTLFSQANDNCPGATNIPVAITTGTTVFFQVNTTSATASAQPTSTNTAGVDDDVWFRFTPQSTGLVVRWRNVSLTPGDDVGVQILDGCNGAELEITTLSTRTDATGAVLLTLSEELIPGVPYLLRTFTAGTTARGTYELGLQGAVNNDPCGSATPIVPAAPGTCMPFTVSTVGTFSNFTETASCATALASNEDVFYSFTATSDFVSLSYSNLMTAGGTTATGVGYALYDQCGGFELACQANFGSGGSGSVTSTPFTPLTIGDTYILQLFLGGENNTGSFDFCLEEAGCVAPTIGYSVIFDECETAGPKLRVAVQDLGSSSNVTINNNGGVAELTITTPGVYEIGPFTTEGAFDFTIDTGSADCNETRNFLLFCPADNQTCSLATPINVNPPGGNGFTAEAKLFFPATSEYSLDPSCGNYQGGDLWYSFTAPSPSITLDLPNNPVTEFGVAAYERDCTDSDGDPEGAEIDCASLVGNGSLVLDGFTIGEDYSLRVFVSGNVERGEADFSIAAVGTLPAELLSFTGVANGKLNHLAWRTTAEEHVSHYILSGSSDGVTGWAVLARVPAANRAGEQAYTHTDADVTASRYYRLTTVDVDGTGVESPVLLVERSFGGMTVFPNPASGRAEVRLAARTEGVVRVYTAEGRLVREVLVANGRGEIDLAGWAAGVYLVRGEGEVRRLVVR